MDRNTEIVELIGPMGPIAMTAAEAAKALKAGGYRLRVEVPDAAPETITNAMPDISGENEVGPEINKPGKRRRKRETRK